MLARSLFKQDILLIYHLELWEVTAFMDTTWYGDIFARISIFIACKICSFASIFGNSSLYNVDSDFRVRWSIKGVRSVLWSLSYLFLVLDLADPTCLELRFCCCFCWLEFLFFHNFFYLK